MVQAQQEMFYEVRVFLPEKGRGVFERFLERTGLSKEEVLEKAIRWFTERREYLLPFYRALRAEREKEVVFLVDSELKESLGELQEIGKVDEASVVYTALALFFGQAAREDLL